MLELNVIRGRNFPRSHSASFVVRCDLLKQAFAKSGAPQGMPKGSVATVFVPETVQPGDVLELKLESRTVRVIVEDVGGGAGAAAKEAPPTVPMGGLTEISNVP